MMIYKIDHDIPLPGRSKYPWRDMELGDSIFIQHEGTGGRAANAASKYAKRTGRTITTRSVHEAGVTGVRIWRIS